MSIAISTERVKVGVVPRTSLSIAYDNLWLPMAQNGGSNDLMPYERRLGGTESTGNLTVAGTTTSCWSTAGVFLPNGTDNTVLLTGGSLDALFRLDTLTTGGLLILVTLVKTAEQSTTRRLLQYGSNAVASPGGINITLTPTVMQCILYPTSGSAITAGAQPAITGAGTYTFCAFIDKTNLTARASVNGDFTGGGTEQDITAIGSLLPGVTTGTYALTFFSAHGSTDIPSNYINTTSGDAKFHSLRVVRLTDDRSADIDTIFAQYHAAPREIPLALT